MHPLTLEVAFCPQTGKLLGAQAVHVYGVDNSIDVLATAMQDGMTIFDLEHLELVCASRFSSTKEPANLAGFVGANVLCGDVKIAHADELNEEMLEKCQVLDV